MDPAFVVLGLVVGTLVGMTGVGAGSLVTPALVHGAQRTLELRTAELLAPLCAALTVVAGAILGVLVTVSSVGAGALGAVLLVALHPSLPAARIAGVDIAHAVPLTLVAGAGHVWLGNVDFALALNLLAFVLLCAGARLAFASA